MKLNSKIIVAITAVVIFGGIFASNSVGYWQTQSSKIPKTFESGEFAGEPMPEDIRGSYSFEDIENAFGVDAGIIAAAFNISHDDPGAIMAKDLEGIYGEFAVEIGTGSLRKFVSLYTGLPYESEDFLLSTAVDVLKANGKWNEEMEQELIGMIFEADTPAPIQVELVEKAPEDEDEKEEEIAVKGKTTVADVISYGIPLEKIEGIMNVHIENENMLIRDLCEQNGLSFSTVKTQLNEMLE